MPRVMSRVFSRSLSSIVSDHRAAGKCSTNSAPLSQQSPRSFVLIARIPGTHIVVEAFLTDRWLRIAKWFWIFYFLRAAPTGSWVTMNNDCSLRVQNVPEEENVGNLQTLHTQTRRNRFFTFSATQEELRSMTSQGGLGQGHCRQKFK